MDSRISPLTTLLLSSLNRDTGGLEGRNDMTSLYFFRGMFKQLIYVNNQMILINLKLAGHTWFSRYGIYMFDKKKKRYLQTVISAKVKD